MTKCFLIEETRVQNESETSFLLSETSEKNLMRILNQVQNDDDFFCFQKHREKNLMRILKRVRNDGDFFN